MEKFNPELIKAVAEERLRILLGGQSPNRYAWIKAICWGYALPAEMP